MALNKISICLTAIIVTKMRKQATGVSTEKGGQRIKQTRQDLENVRIKKCGEKTTMQKEIKRKCTKTKRNRNLQRIQEHEKTD